MTRSLVNCKSLIKTIYLLLDPNMNKLFSKMKFNYIFGDAPIPGNGNEVEIEEIESENKATLVYKEYCDEMLDFVRSYLPYSKLNYY